MNKELAFGNIMVRTMDFDEAGTVVESHAHNFDHFHMNTRGRSHVDTLHNRTGEVVHTQTCDGRMAFENGVLIPAGVRHRIRPETTREIEQSALRAALVRRGMRNAEIDAIVDESSHDVQPLDLCIYSQRMPQSLVERKGTNPEFDALLDQCIALSNKVHGDIVQRRTGWRPAIE